MNIRKYDYLVIGGGSGGSASARYVAQKFKKSVALIEHKKPGGTCVNVGCMPKKMNFYAQTFLEQIPLMKNFGFDTQYKFNYQTLKQNRDQWISRINNYYVNIWKENNVEYIKGYAKFINKNQIKVGEEIFEGKNILIAAGSKPFIDKNIEGYEHSITSDDYFGLQTLPKRTIVVGGGYIAIELAQQLSGFGTQTTLLVRSKILKFLCEDIVQSIEQNIKLSGCDLKKGVTIKSIKKQENNELLVTLSNNEQLITDQVLMATGRVPDTQTMDLQNSEIKLGNKNEIIVNENHQTNIEHIFAVGDCIEKVNLTPVAIRAGRIVGEYLYGNKNIKMDYENVPTVIFGHPPIISIGMNEQQAIQKYGQDEIETFHNKTNGVEQSLELDSNKKYQYHLKLICLKNQNQKIVGLQGVGAGLEESIQAFGIAIKMGATLKDFHNTIAVHPTLTENFVLMDFKL